MKTSTLRFIHRISWASLAVATAVGVAACAHDDSDETVAIDLDNLSLQGEAQYAQVDFPVDSCKSLGMAFGDSLVASQNASRTSEAPEGSSDEPQDHAARGSAAWLNQIKHINSLSSALTRSGLSCTPEELLLAAETRLPASARASIYVGIPAPGVTRAELTSYDEWRRTVLGIFRVITNPPEHLKPSP